VCDQATAFVKHTQKNGLGSNIVMHDRDTTFTASFDDALKEGGWAGC